MIYCNNITCKFNNDKVCNAKDTYVVERRCVSAKRKPQEDNYKALMQEAFKANCHKENGGYKSNRVKVIK